MVGACVYFEKMELIFSVAQSFLFVCQSVSVFSCPQASVRVKRSCLLGKKKRINCGGQRQRGAIKPYIDRLYGPTRTFKRHRCLSVGLNAFHAQRMWFAALINFLDDESSESLQCSQSERIQWQLAVFAADWCCVTDGTDIVCVKLRRMLEMLEYHHYYQV